MKKSFLFFITVTTYIFLSCSNDEKHIVIEANSPNATIMVDGELISKNWIISPEISPDVLPIEIEQGKTKRVTFLTDLDSVSYKMELGDIRDFTVILKNKDSALTRMEGVPGRVNFTIDYIEKNKGKWSVEIVESQELFQIVAVISPTGLADTKSMIINHDNTDYYRSVIDHFLPYKDEPIVGIIDGLLQKNWYLNLKADACALEFDENDKLQKTNIYDRMRGDKNLFEPFMKQLNDFAKRSGFRTFFQNNIDYYNSLIEWHERAISTKEQWDWLEEQFPDHYYDHYRITFSPLVKGNHSTVRFNNNGFKQAVMFIRPPYKVKSVNENISNGLITRMVFTEIDHNYVNPETDKYLNEVNVAFNNKEKWTNGKESIGYKTPYAIFNEYMTWSVYLLYCYDKYQKEDFDVINDRIINYVVNRRGFHRFDDFHSALLNQYMNKAPSKTVADLYPDILEWSLNYDPVSN